MKYKDKFDIAPEFESLFEFSSKEKEIEHEAKMIMVRFLSEFEKLNTSIKRKDLAKIIGTSASYVTQLFNGDKLINLITLAKLQDAYNFTFDIKAVSNFENYNSQELVLFNEAKFDNNSIGEKSLWLSKSQADSLVDIYSQQIDNVPDALQIAA